MKTDFLKEINTILSKYSCNNLSKEYNIFWALGVESDELCISSFIANLLNPNTTLHNKGHRFLQLFIEVVNNEITTEDRNGNMYLSYSHIEDEYIQVYKEYPIGKIRSSCKNGGRIDILIKANTKAIVIENKINASDQPNQLLRYYNYVKDNYLNGMVLYLSLYGKMPSSNSNNFKDNKKYFECISYKNTICHWLSLCENEPGVDESLKNAIHQCLIACKSITGQKRNNKMDNELVDILLDHPENIEAAIEIGSIIKKMKVCIIRDKILPELHKIANMKCLIEGVDAPDKVLINSTRELGSQWWGFVFTDCHSTWKIVKIRFEFENEDYTKINYSIRYLKDKARSDYGYFTLDSRDYSNIVKNPSCNRVIDKIKENVEQLRLKAIEYESNLTTAST